MESFLFYFFGLAAIATAVLMTVQRNPVMSAIYLIGNFFCIASLYLLLRAQFLAVIQIVVYTGAIMVLVVFVIMLLNLGEEEKLRERFDVKRVLGVVLAAGLLAQLIVLFGSGDGSPSGSPGAWPEPGMGGAQSMGDALFGRFVLGFEVTSLLLLAAMVGAVVLARKRI
ncbi:MAG: NADH-quinone oxidoreductase subunit J [Bacteroidota bacterium]